MEAAPAPEPQRGGNPIPAIIAGGAIGKAIAIKGERSFWVKNGVILKTKELDCVRNCSTPKNEPT